MRDHPVNTADCRFLALTGEHIKGLSFIRLPQVYIFKKIFVVDLWPAHFTCGLKIEKEELGP